MVPHLMNHVPKEYNRYFEPFFGGGALFFAIRPETAILSDKNEDLMACFSELRDQPGAVIECLSKLPKNELAYYRVRESNPLKGAERAARFIYLATLSFNGIYRVNLHGKFNVPYGHRPHLQVCDEERIMGISAALQGQKLLCCDFEEAVMDAEQSDLVYLDPPYTVAHAQNGFLKYNASIFSWKDQRRLADIATELAQRGCYVIISNAYHELIRDLYTSLSAHRIDRHSVMAAKGEFRKEISEYMFTNTERKQC